MQSLFSWLKDGIIDDEISEREFILKMIILFDQIEGTMCWASTKSLTPTCLSYKEMLMKYLSLHWPS